MTVKDKEINIINIKNILISEIYKNSIIKSLEEEITTIVS